MKTEKQGTEAEKTGTPGSVFKRKKEMTRAAYQEQQTKGKLMHDFFCKIGGVLCKGMVNRGKKSTEMQVINLGFKWNQDIITGAHPNYKIDYKKVVISKGDLGKPERAIVKQKTKLKVELSWKKTLNENAKVTDQMCWLEYNASNKESILITSDNLRCSGKDTMILESPNIVGDEIHYWMFFISENGRKRSDSVYLGTLE